MTPNELIQQMDEAEFKSRLIAELEVLASANPDFCYTTAKHRKIAGDNIQCRYNAGPEKKESLFSYNSSPLPCSEEQSKGCIFGRALRAMGIELGDSTLGIASFLRASGAETSFERKCRVIQGMQDGGARWGTLPIEGLKGL